VFDSPQLVWVGCGVHTLLLGLPIWTCHPLFPFWIIKGHVTTHLWIWVTSPPLGLFSPFFSSIWGGIVLWLVDHDVHLRKRLLSHASCCGSCQSLIIIAKWAQWKSVNGNVTQPPKFNESNYKKEKSYHCYAS
jgi:hypothetical protein